MTSSRKRKPRAVSESARGLTSEQKKLLYDLMKLKNATPIQFAVVTGRVGQNIEQKLDQLENKGWVKSKDIPNGLESKVYYVSAKTLGVLRPIAREDFYKGTKGTLKKVVIRTL